MGISTDADQLELQKLFDEIPHEEDEKNKGNYCDKIKGLLACFLWIVMVVISVTCCQLLQRNIPDFELNTLRLTTGLVFCLFGLLYTREFPSLQKSEIMITFLFGLVKCTCSLTIFVAVTFIPISSAECISVTSTIVSGIILYRIFLDEKITVKRSVFAFLCIFGVLLVIQPDFIFKDKRLEENRIGISEIDQLAVSVDTTNVTMETISHTVKIRSAALVALAYVLPIISGTMIPTDVVIIKRFPFLGERLLTVAFWCLATGAMVSAVGMAIFEKPLLPNDWFNFGLVAGHCITYVIIWPASIYAAIYISGNVINVIYSTMVIFLLIPQYTVLSSILPGHRNWIEVVGVVLVLLGSAMGSILEMYRSKLPTTRSSS